MSELKLLGRILKLRKIVRIKRYEFRNRDNELHIWVKPYRNGCKCKACKRRSIIVRVLPNDREWKDLRICGITVFLHYAPREIRCPTHGRSVEEIPWAEEYAQVTYRFDFVMLRYCQGMTQKMASELLHISPSTLSGLLHRTIKRIRAGHKIRGVRTLGVDEISFRKGKRYATVVYDLDRAVVVWVGYGKGAETLINFFKNCLSEFQRKEIHYACCDMSRAYISTIKEYCPNATLVLDRFHIVKALNNAVDEVRKQEWRSLQGTEEGRALKGLRWLLFLHSDNRTKKNTALLNNLCKRNRRIWRAWVLKDEFERFWSFTYIGAAKSFVNGWMTSARKSRLEPLRDFVDTLKEHLDNVLSYLESHLTNAVGEGINRIIKLVKNRASGFHNLCAFADMIYLTIGDVDIPEQIPVKFRTL
jgi:transposase